jgi:neopullulanase
MAPKNSLFSVAVVLIAALLSACTGAAKPNAGATAPGASPATPTETAMRARLPQDEIVYFVIPDRFENAEPSNDQGGLSGDRLAHGFDPSARGFYHGGDLKGLISRLDYIEGLGASAIWLGPVYQNKAVQGPKGDESSGYHGYWITDFTTTDRHLGTDADMKAFVDAAHARGMKVYLDIITNHTADVIKFRECSDPNWKGQKVKSGCPYRSVPDYPYTAEGGINGTPINPGFMGDQAPFQTRENFARLTNLNYAYHPYIPPGEETVKKPAWLNEMRHYHNRGDTIFENESSTYGDFVGLDDLLTESPEVVDGFIDIYKDWITRYRIDGFRIDTARHVNPEFWRAFNPAMIEHAKSLGIPNFYVFGEAFIVDPAGLARFRLAECNV